MNRVQFLDEGNDCMAQKADSRRDKPDRKEWTLLTIAFIIILIVIFWEFAQ